MIFSDRKIMCTSSQSTLLLSVAQYFKSLSNYDNRQHWSVKTVFKLEWPKIPMERVVLCFIMLEKRLFTQRMDFYQQWPINLVLEQSLSMLQSRYFYGINVQQPLSAVATEFLEQFAVTVALRRCCMLEAVAAQWGVFISS